MSKKELVCGICKNHSCKTGNWEKMPPRCPSRDSRIEEINQLYTGQDLFLAQKAARVESDGYCAKTRLEEIMDFARKCGYQKIGVAFCIGLYREMATLQKILTANGFDVSSVICKVGSVPKEQLLMENEGGKVRSCSYEAMCNPIAQACFLNDAGTEMNLVLGLCVGHDTLFFRHSQAPVTVLAVKDRVLGHNPLAAIYLAEGYYRKKLLPEESPPNTCGK